MNEPQPMTPYELAAAVKRELELARDYSDGDVQDERELAYRYYRGFPFGNEKNGRSQVISQVVQETVDGLLPDLTKIFCGGDRPVEFVARNAEDVPLSEQATESVAYVLERNDWLLRFFEGAKDALLAKCGAWKVYWDDESEVSRETYSGVSEAALSLMTQDGSVQIVAATPIMGAMEPMYDVTLERTEQAGFPRIVTIPPEELLVSPRATSINPQEAPFIAHSRKVTRSELVEMGYDLQTVMDLPSAGSDPTGEGIGRSNQDNSLSDDSADPMQGLVEYAECYLRVDANGDGISELRNVCISGETILHDDVVERVPIAVIVYKLMPHEFYGPSLADDVMDLQLLKSQVWRMTMDSLYLSINPRQVVIEGQARLDDVLNPTPGGVIRAKSMGAVTPLEIPFVGAQATPMMELIEQEIEGRTPVSRYYQGLDPKGLNKTATGMSILTSRNQAQAELVARVWAETGVRWLMETILFTLAKHQSQPMIVRLRNQYIPIDPRAWKTKYDVSVNVGLGTGNKAEQMAMLSTIAQAQAMAVQGGGMGMVVEPKHLYNTQAKIAQLAGFKDPGMFWKDPGEDYQPPPPQDPPEVLAEREKAKGAFEVKKVDAASDQIKADKDNSTKRYQALVDAAVKLLIAGDKSSHMAEDRSVGIQGDMMDREDSARSEAMDRDERAQEREDGQVARQEDRQDRHRTEDLQPIMLAIKELAKALTAPQQKTIMRDGSGKVVGINRKAG